jgi:Fe2+ transport system protein FeoA
MLAMMRMLGRRVAAEGREPCGAAAGDVLTLRDVPLSRPVELLHIDLPEEDLEALLERGILPGCRICPIRHSPSGDPIVAVDGSLIALRRETAACLCVRMLDPAEA